jgi:undecaprenyl diphosphate synthase
MDGRPYSSDISRIDLMIRWGGMRRLSGFLPIQTVYSDFYVVGHYWPDFKEEDFHNALAWYAEQDITLGG